MNPRPSAWKAETLPLSYPRSFRLQPPSAICDAGPYSNNCAVIAPLSTIWSLGPGLNRWPRPYQGRALPSELPRRVPVSPRYIRIKSETSPGRRASLFLWNSCPAQTFRLPISLIMSDHSQLTSRVSGGRGRIRTSVARKERQIYSLLVLATHPPVPQTCQT